MHAFSHSGGVSFSLYNFLVNIHRKTVMSYLNGETVFELISPEWCTTCNRHFTFNDVLTRYKNTPLQGDGPERIDRTVIVKFDLDFSGERQKNREGINDIVEGNIEKKQQKNTRRSEKCLRYVAELFQVTGKGYLMQIRANFSSTFIRNDRRAKVALNSANADAVYAAVLAKRVDTGQRASVARTSSTAGVGCSGFENSRVISNRKTLHWHPYFLKIANLECRLLIQEWGNWNQDAKLLSSALMPLIIISNSCIPTLDLTPSWSKLLASNWDAWAKNYPQWI